MADEVKVNSAKTIVASNLIALSDLDNFQKYILGTKKNGQPRALYDVVKDQTAPKKKKKGKKHSDGPNSYELLLTAKKKKKKKKNKKHWHI